MNLPNQIVELLQSTPARVGLNVQPLDGSGGFSVLAGEVFTQASAIKIPILSELHRQAVCGDLALDETIPVDPADGAGGCGLLQNFLPGASRMALADLGVLMIVLSDNVATNLLIERLGFDAVNGLLESVGCEKTRLRRKMIDLVARREGRENTSTPAEAVDLMVRLHDHEAAGDAAAAQTLRVLRLKKESPITAALPQGLSLATKPGMLEGLRTEWSLVEGAGPGYAMAIMADGAEDSVLEPLFRRLAEEVHRICGAARG